VATVREAAPIDSVTLRARIVYSALVVSYRDLESKVALVSGGANGIGAATVRALHHQGARVYFCDVDSVAGNSLSAELKGVRFTAVDLRQERQIIRWVAEVRKEEPVLHILVNNAALDPRIALPDLTAAKIDELFAINLKPFFILARECAPYMPPTESSIINLGSITFHTGPAKMSAYVATKAGIIGFTRSLARELGAAGIRVNTVSPGWVMTERQLREFVKVGTKKLIKAAQCVPELLKPEEIAGVILFLASNASSAITGQEILADRGWAHS